MRNALKTIRFWTTHPEKSPGGWGETFCLDREKFALVYDPDHPDYLIATEQIYTEASCMREFIRRNTPERVSIFFAGEAISPDMNVFDYAVAFDRNFSLGDRVSRLPTLDFFRKSIFDESLTVPRSDAREALREKTGFCNFIYSNPNAHPNRDLLFRTLSGYRSVDSLGPHLNNVGTAGSRASDNWRKEAIALKRPYKFSIACENARFNGYTTEKILSSFQARTIPVYWGDPSIAEEFNPKAFVNANACVNFAEVLELVKEIDCNDVMWLAMASEPIMTETQMARHQDDHRRFMAFSERLFGQDLTAAKRAPSGYWNDNYYRWFEHPAGGRSRGAAMLQGWISRLSRLAPR